MKFTAITLFPEMFESPMAHSMMWKAQDKNLITLNLINLRDFGLGPRKQVDDTPYGGGDGMLLKPEPMVTAIEHALSSTSTKRDKIRVVLLSPQGARFKQLKARQLQQDCEEIILICGRYEGFDNRIRDYVDEQLSIGDFVLTGGELAALTVIDSVSRLIPGVLGGENSAIDESFTKDNTLEYPHYTKPYEFRGQKVPDVLLSGNHADINAWRDQNSKKVSE